jgi:hypothetical protein
MGALPKRFLWTLAVIGLAAGFQLIKAGFDDDSPAAQIEAALSGYYEDPAPGQCAQLTTARFRSTVYGGSGQGALEACREHQEARAEMPELDRTVFIEQIRVDGDEAVAEVRAGGVSLIESLVEEGGEWRLDDEVSPFHDSAGGEAAMESLDGSTYR